MLIEILFELIVMHLFYWIGSLSIFNKLNTEKKKILSDNISFYNKLSKVDKRKFEYRITRFVNKHEFIGREGLQITPFVEMMVSAAPIMLTFHLQNYLFKHFKTILIYPKNFLSRQTNQMHKGETNPGMEAVVLSFESLLKGITIEDDNLHLGIHEFSHALYFSYVKQTTVEAIRFKSTVKKMFKLISKPNQKQKLLAANYVREYGYENKHEFLAVITENYFETPKEFKQKLPKLFKLVNKLYKIY